jgi:hypothetical protein
MIAWITTATVLFIILAIVWSGKDWLNLILKLAFIGMSLSGIFYVLTLSGYIVKAG